MPAQLWTALAVAVPAAALLAGVLALRRAEQRRKRVRAAAHRLVENDLLDYELSKPLEEPRQRPARRRMLLCLKVQTEQPRTYVLDPAHGQGIFFGRDPQCEVCVSEAVVSGRHCRIFWDGCAVILQDMRSANGTQVRRGFFRRWWLRDSWLALKSKDRFWVGHTAFEVQPFLYDDTLM